MDFRKADDAGVYRWESGPALVQTVDFFTPIVDDPYIYGQIAAANAVSDIYAMGGRPLTALAIAAFPKEGLETGTIRDIFRGGFDKLREAGVSLLGGHTVQDLEIKFGYAVTGSIDPARVLANAGAQVGDVLFLTKPLGTGIVGTAIKFDRVEPALAEEAVLSMRTLNRAAAGALRAFGRRRARCTDITGSGSSGTPRNGQRERGDRDSGREKVTGVRRVLAIAGRNQSAVSTRTGYFPTALRWTCGLTTTESAPLRPETSAVCSRPVRRRGSVSEALRRQGAGLESARSERPGRRANRSAP
jgi:selenide,water dikinase